MAKMPFNFVAFTILIAIQSCATHKNEDLIKSLEYSNEIILDNNGRILSAIKAQAKTDVRENTQKILRTAILVCRKADEYIKQLDEIDTKDLTIKLLEFQDSILQLSGIEKYYNANDLFYSTASSYNVRNSVAAKNILLQLSSSIITELANHLSQTDGIRKIEPGIYKIKDGEYLVVVPFFSRYQDIEKMNIKHFSLNNVALNNEYEYHLLKEYLFINLTTTNDTKNLSGEYVLKISVRYKSSLYHKISEKPIEFSFNIIN